LPRALGSRFLPEIRPVARKALATARVIMARLVAQYPQQAK
jgi:hypothetical protein